MKMLKKIILISIIIPVSIKAKCTNEDLSRYKLLASNIENYYTFDDNTKKMNITIYNLSNEIILKQEESIIETNDKIGEATIDNISPGQTIKLYMYPKSGECEDYALRTLYINLPHYNKYYDDEICKNNNNKLCSKWVNTDIYTKEQFEQKVKKQETQEEQQIEPETETSKNTILEYILKYYMIVLLLIITIGLILIYKLDKKQKFDF